MALAKTVTKIMPTKTQIGLHLLLTDNDHPITEGIVTVIDKDFTENFSKGSGMSNEVRNAVGRKAQEAIDDYILNKRRCKAAAYGTAVNQIDNNLDISE